MYTLEHYKNRKVFVTGHTGFKGSWMCEALLEAGADVTGYALEPDGSRSLFQMLSLDKRMKSIEGDIRDLDSLKKAFQKSSPEVVIHMAAQPIVRESYRNPVYTYDVNVMGTVNVLECVRQSKSVKSVVNVTTDKVYKNREWEWGYRENEELNGFDPYSNSKSCSELVTASYVNSFLKEKGIAVSTMRAGNVIGGGDYAADRIIPDCVRAAESGMEIVIRNPYSIRPYQHVLEPVMAYLMVADRQLQDPSLAGSYNVGPEENDCVNTEYIAEEFCRCWKQRTGKDVSVAVRQDGGPHEAGYLKLDCSRIRKVFGWRPVWNIEKAIWKSVELYVDLITGREALVCMERQIREFGGELENAEFR